MMMDDLTAEEYFEHLCKEFEKNGQDYSLYYMLGTYYESRNINQAWLCYENAEFYCKDEEDLKIIRERKSSIEAMKEWSVRKISIVILSYNLKEICCECIESIRKNNSPDSYEIIVVDNASSDGITDWLKEQKDIKLVCNEENKGFPHGCNQGIKISAPDNDIFLLNNDTLIMPNSIFWLRMGLYENERVGATGSVTNFASNGQMITEHYATVEEYYKYALRNNIAKKNPYEKKIWLVGFAMLIKRRALDEIGLLDTRFTPGGFEDNDIGVRLNYAGWKLLLCTNSFIYHYGSGSGKNLNLWKNLESVNSKKFKEKWSFNIGYYTWAREDIISLIHKEENAEFSVLEVGCGCGATLARISHRWPNATVKGIELVEDVARIGANFLDVRTGNIETMEIPFEKESFDYIIFGDVLEHLYSPEEALKRLKPYLKRDGRYICSIPNIMHSAVIVSLLKGKFEYQESGILDRTHIRFFTLESIVTLMRECGLKIDEFSLFEDGVERTEEEKRILDALCQIPGVADRDWFVAYQYVFSAKLR